MRTPRPFIYSVQLFLACQQINRPPGYVEFGSKAKPVLAATKVFFFTLALSTRPYPPPPQPILPLVSYSMSYSYLSVDGTHTRAERDRELHPNVIHYKRVHKLPTRQPHNLIPSTCLSVSLPARLPAYPPTRLPIPPIRQQYKSSLIKLCTYKLSRVTRERERESASYLPCSMPCRRQSPDTFAVPLLLPLPHPVPLPAAQPVPSFCFCFRFNFNSLLLANDGKTNPKWLPNIYLHYSSVMLSLFPLLAKFIALAWALS